MNVSVATEGQDAQRNFNGVNNYMEVSDPNVKSVSSVKNTNEGKIRSGSMGSLELKSSNPMPHEFGHMLGLSDKYIKGKENISYGKPISDKWKGDIMGMKSGAGKVSSKTMSGVLAKPLKLNSIINPANTKNKLKVNYYINKYQREEETNKY